jgi:BirA family biotin operon repressor/biotin-[acetyl-CoA-carboxylase] ligase
MLVSIILFEFFKKLKIPNLRIKWPNDILSAEKKISGILIESTIKSNKINDYIIGLGLNINQEKFNNLLNANSIKNITGVNYDLNEIANSLIKTFENFDDKLIKYSVEEIKIKYLKNLYGLNSLIEFFYNGEKLSGKITDVLSDHKIKLIIDDKEKVFDSTEIKLIF